MTNCKINLKPVCNVAKKIINAARPVYTKVCDKLSSVYFVYDVDVKKTSHLTPNKTDEAGNEKNVITTTSKGQIKLSAKDIICFVAVFGLVLSVAKRVLRRALK